MVKTTVTRTKKHGLQVDSLLADFVETHALPGTGISADDFWKGFSDIAHDLGPKNKGLLEKRETIQGQVDAWHVGRRNQVHDHVAYKAFLIEIGYITNPLDAKALKDKTHLSSVAHSICDAIDDFFSNEHRL